MKYFLLISAVVFVAISSAFDARAATQLYPPWSHVSGGKLIETSGYIDRTVSFVTFGSKAALEVGERSNFCDDEEPNLPCIRSYYAIAPPQAEAGPVDVVIEFVEGGFEVLPFGFVYYDAPIVEKVTPNVHSVLPDTTLVTVFARGVSVNPEVEVLFGGAPATGLVVEENSPWTEIKCLPPPFPGGSFPKSVDVRVINPEGDAGTLNDGFRYDRILPVITGIQAIVPTVAWTTGIPVFVDVEHVVNGSVRVYFDGFPAGYAVVSSRYPNSIFCVVPPRAPGLVSVTVVNGDGGIYTKVDAFTYTGTPSTDFHTGDLNHDFRFSMSEVLRVVQFFNSGGMHCDAASEDGYAPGVGNDLSCAPYPSDNDPFNWNLGLTELLQIIQLYNMYCYQPCPGAPGTYCPPD